MIKIIDVAKITSILLITGCAVYSTWLLHRVVEQGKSLSIYGITFEPTLPIAVRLINEPIEVRVRDQLQLSDRNPIRVQTVGPVESNTFVTIMNRLPIKVEIADTPVPVRPVR